MARLGKGPHGMCTPGRVQGQKMVLERWKVKTLKAGR